MSWLTKFLKVDPAIAAARQVERAFRAQDKEALRAALKLLARTGLSESEARSTDIWIDQIFAVKVG